METSNATTEKFDESQSIQVIREMIQVSQKKIKDDGILFILWGWLWFIGRIIDYYFWVYPHTHLMKQIKNVIGGAAFLFVLLFTIIYLYRKRKRLTTYIGISLRYIWISLVLGMSLISMILFNVLEEPDFKLQHPIFMVFIAFAVVATGGILRYKLLIVGGAIFAGLAYIASFFAIEEQLLIESVAWLFAFVVPGHWLYFKRNK